MSKDKPIIVYGNLMSSQPKPANFDEMSRKFAEHQVMANMLGDDDLYFHTPIWPLLIPVGLLIFFLWSI